MSQNVNTNLIDLRDLLDLLRRHPLATPFNLALYSERQGKAGLIDPVLAVCRPVAGQKLCTQQCLQQWEDLISLALLSDRPQIRICAKGFIGFALPLPADDRIPDCLIGGGIRERLTATTADSPTGEETPPGQDDQRPLPAATREETRQIAEEVARLLPQLLEQKLHDLSLARVTERLTATREIVRELWRCASAGEAVALVSEALVVLFDLPRVLLLLRQTGRRPTIHSSLGIEPGSFEVAEGPLAEMLEQAGGLPFALSGDELTSFLPGVKGRSALLFPLQESSRGIGLLAVLDVDLHQRDQALIELLAGRLATRLLRLRQDEELHQERHFSARLVSMISTLALAESREELFNGLLNMSAELADATSGSLMLFDEHSQNLHIAVAKGMSPPLARSMAVPIGEGIAGRVARNGFPLLVNDIERDSRVATPNRPRFRTKSFISIPLKDQERLVGVLNLADKRDDTSFTEADLNLVHSFTNQAVLMIDRAAVLERAVQLEKLSITDPLTGLYNRRFLENRLEEERSRSQRQMQSFSVILADLDNFKLYNDICGHLAGDKALRKAAMLMKRAAREMDLVVRYGGEEFCLILPNTSKKESLFVAERLRRSIEGDIFPGETNLPLGRLTISLGVAAYPEDADAIHDLIHAADLALYRAKDLGRNRTVFYDPSLARNQHAARLHEDH
ncbi:MAG: sensor domain-containing diguanylate cyclase [Desulfuromonadales bacterium]|nr:sensor domain-containing diguanylate cyclase [Desulfuromonadales bacterium]